MSWFHVTITTYGQWLRGDPRGWRARHHREHCEGDYKHRPDPAAHADALRLSQKLMQRDPVKIDTSIREIVARSIAERLEQDFVEVLVVAMGAKHLHLLGNFPGNDPRIRVGIAKQFTTVAVKDHCSTVGHDLNLKLGEGIWGKRSRAEPIRDRAHQIQTLLYIVRHVNEGASLWLAPNLQKKSDALVTRACAKRKKPMA